MLQIEVQKDACSWAVRKTPTLHGLQRVRRVDQHLAHICNQARMILVSKIGTMLHGRGYDGGGGSPPSGALARARGLPGHNTGSGAAALDTHRALSS